ncbi:MAG: hypothetical protein ACFB0C_05750 [Leptolyngbyaceae cyanobacterium]
MQRPSDPSLQAPEDQTLWQSLHRYWQALSGFMVHRAPGAPTLHPAQRRYSAKGRLYAYLPSSEEQRDWLEQIYHQS